jgi:hypothetical protein
MVTARSAWLTPRLLLLAVTLVGCGSSSTEESLGGVDGSVDGAHEEAEAAAPAPLTTTVLDKARIGSRNSTGWPYAGAAVTDVDFGGGPFAKVTLVVDLESGCFPFDKWKTDLPPPRQNWPPSCDAFDRNFSIFIDDRPEIEAGAGPDDSGKREAQVGDDASDAAPPLETSGSDASADTAATSDATETPLDDAGPTAEASGDSALPEGAPREAGPSNLTSAQPYEIVHAITPFGGPEHIEVDITDLANGLRGKHRLRVDIDAWSDRDGRVTGSNNGWTVSAKLQTTAGTPPHNVLAVIPLYAGRQGSTDLAPVVPFTVPARTIAGRLEYRTSGHGGANSGFDFDCRGPAEEFCRRTHAILLDGAMVKELEPWRTDCASLCTLTEGGPFGPYCLENPCGLPASVRAPRANWCPGSMTLPSAWEDIPALSAAGPHTWSFEVSTILPGGNWQVSAIYYAFGP